MAVGQNIIENCLLESFSSIGVLELPCGLYIPEENGEPAKVITECEVREMTGEDEDLLGSRKVPPHQKVVGLIGRCVTRIGDITDRAIIHNLIPQLPGGDRLFLLIKIRQVSLGDVVPYDIVCPKCEKSHMYTFDLNDFVVRNMPDRFKRVYEVKLPSGKEAIFHLMLGSDEARMEKASSDLDGASLPIWARLDLLNGKAPTINDVKRLSLRDRAYLRGMFEEVEGGVDLGLELECAHCGFEFEDRLDLGHTGFFSPSATLRKWKRRSST